MQIEPIKIPGKSFARSFYQEKQVYFELQ
ncbi:hypothetical protein AZE42_12403 [Rhizopogon vesiculosus]|uniref:Uncharacterized protein n=1 Tax=Rhizopogon vesiculosus TaxID=180088 RepID=A0A1J8QR15_9AGAM|nr:hypothetical protein AZE42_12403 [Rhizopogon vesiculosus]